MWVEIIVVIVVLVVLAYFWVTFLSNRIEVFCAWCQNPRPPRIRTPASLKIPKSRGTLAMLQGEVGNYWWHYRNIDGSRDHRVNGNYQLANYFSKWVCVRCGATTAITHEPDQSPSVDKDSVLVSLISPGSMEKKLKDKRRGYDRDSTRFRKKGYTSVSGPHRKGDEQ